MSIIKLPEDYAIKTARNQVRDALAYHGEEAVLLQMFHPEVDRGIGRCPRCSGSAYRDGENDCPTCFGTNLYDVQAQVGGVKRAQRAWCIFSDHVVSEQYGQQGVVAPDTRQVQCEAFPMLMAHDFIARVKRWDPLTRTALSEPDFYAVQAVTRNSLRTGNRFGQTWEDVIGQAAQCSLLPPRTHGIQNFQIQGESFPQATVQSNTVPVVVPQPDTHVVFYPITPGVGQVTGSPAVWEAAFTYTQTAPSTLWTIHHTLGHKPQVAIIVGGEEVDADIDYPDANTITISFENPQSGYAELV